MVSEQAIVRTDEWLRTLHRMEADLAAATRVQELVEIKARIGAMRSYLEELRVGITGRNELLGLELKCQMRLATLVDEGQSAGEIAVRGQVNQHVRDPDMLDGLGLDRRRVHEWRLLGAAYSEADVDRLVATATERGQLLSESRVLAGAKRVQAVAAGAEPVPDITATERQRRHRLMQSLRPAHPLPEVINPMEVAAGLLVKLEVVASHVGTPALQGMCEEIAEGIKQVTWWPRL